jgi:phage gp36-like protein
MAENLSGNIDRFEANDLKQFTMVATASRPSTVGYNLYDPLGALLPVNSITAANSGITVQESGALTARFHIEYVLPTTEGFYIGEWVAYDAASRTGKVRDEFEVVRTEATSFFTYGNLPDILRTGRQIFGRGAITPREFQPYMQSADGIIDSKLGTIDAITIPLSPVPAIVQEWNKTITLWHFYSERFAINREQPPPGLKDRYDEAIESLTDIQSGNSILHVSSGVVYKAAYDFSSTTVGYKPVFDMRDFEQQRVSPDILDADASADGTTSDEDA